MEDRNQLRKDLKKITSRIGDIELQADACAAYLNTGQLDSPKKEFYEALFYISSIDCELRRFLDIVFTEDGKSNIWIDKYLVLLVHECLDTVPVVFNRLIKASSNGGKVNAVVLRKAMKEFKKSTKADMDKLDMTKIIDIVRNRVSAHHLDKQGSLDSFISWHAITRNSKFKEIIEKNSLATSALCVSMHLQPLGIALRDADNAGYANELSAFYKASVKTFSLNN